jgi:hypothetical protein
MGEPEKNKKQQEEKSKEIKEYGQPNPLYFLALGIYGDEYTDEEEMKKVRKNNYAV